MSTEPLVESERRLSSLPPCPFAPGVLSASLASGRAGNCTGLGQGQTKMLSHRRRCRSAHSLKSHRQKAHYPALKVKEPIQEPSISSL